MSIISPLSPEELIDKPHARLGNTPLSALALLLANLTNQDRRCRLVILPDQNSVWQLEANLQFFLHSPESIVTFNDWETLPYDPLSPSSELLSARLRTLAKLPRLSHGLILTSITTLMQRLSPTQYLLSRSFALQKGETFSISDARIQLTSAGYRKVEQVMEHGEFAIRGSLFDIYPMGHESAYRIDLFDDEIESIRVFNPSTQRTESDIDLVELLPAHEFPLDEEGITTFRQQFRQHFPGNPTDCPLYEDVSNGQAPAGIEYYLPLFFNETSSLFDYLNDDTHVVLWQNAHKPAERFWEDARSRYEQRRYDVSRPILAPNELFIPTQDLFALIKQRASVHCFKEALNNSSDYDLALTRAPDLLIEQKQSAPLARVAQFLQDASDPVLFCVESAGRREAMIELLAKIDLTPVVYNSWQAFIAKPAALAITVAPLVNGMLLEQDKLILLSEAQLFGKLLVAERRRQVKTINEGSIIRNLLELDIGMPVVHVDHGVGRYLGLQNMAFSGEENEFLVIEYQDNDKIYVPVTCLHLVSRFTGASPENAPINRLGSDAFKRAKKKAAKKIRDVAAELLALYAKREASQGFAYQRDKEQLMLFAASFPYELTPDQARAINAVISDMSQKKPMDRLVCGDVGFGKTEVAIRAAFFAAINNKQTAVFVPTTLLAEQHFETFRDRFADWPVTVEVLSRFKTAKEQEAIIAKLGRGKIDIIIGTHKLLNPAIKFHNLGLLIVDEEHRFGVTHKEKIKKLRAEVDILTLTATPIPRTLNMAFSGIRDFSIIATAPTRRLPVKTFIQQHSDTVISEAIRREVARGGQVYYLYNKVETIDRVAHDLMQLLPDVRMQVAHGQMRERELEHIMTAFHHQKFSVLIATTIIESGIDIPTANTIIIERADKFGLAQLHQMRGRVGRSHHQAYAYLLVPDKHAMTRDALKRIEAISSLEALGAGFQLATHDMEIRGAGELLGDAQSGQMQTIGLSLYLEMLERAVKALKEGKEPDFDGSIETGPEINCHIPALIPDDYIGDIQVRLGLYKRLSSCESEQEIDELQVEMIDRFGLLPDQIKQLFAVTKLKQKAKAIGISKIDASTQGGTITFTAKPNLDPMRLITMIQTRPNKYQMAGSEKLKFKFTSETPAQRLEVVEGVLTALVGDS